MIAHRGASADAPENTLAAFRLARAQGADGVELDVMRCAHGRGGRLPRRRSRRGSASAPGAGARRARWPALREIDLGGGERIPLLDEVLEELGPLLVNVELKSAPAWRGALVDDGLAAAVADRSSRATRVGARVLVSSFDPLLLARFRAARAASVPTGLLFAHDQSRPLREAWAAPLLRPPALHPEALLVDARARRAAGTRAATPSTSGPSTTRPSCACLAALGVDGLITNRPTSWRAP